MKIARDLIRYLDWFVPFDLMIELKKKYYHIFWEEKEGLIVLFLFVDSFRLLKVLLVSFWVRTIQAHLWPVW